MLPGASSLGVGGALAAAPALNRVSSFSNLRLLLESDDMVQPTSSFVRYPPGSAAQLSRAASSSQAPAPGGGGGGAAGGSSGSGSAGVAGAVVAGVGGSRLGRAPAASLPVDLLLLHAVPLIRDLCARRLRLKQAQSAKLADPR